MIRNIVSHIGGIEAFGLVSIAIFFAFFLGMLTWAFRLNRRHLDRMSRLPLDDDEPGRLASHHPKNDSAHE